MQRSLVLACLHGEEQTRDVQRRISEQRCTVLALYESIQLSLFCLNMLPLAFPPEELWHQNEVSVSAAPCGLVPH